MDARCQAPDQLCSQSYFQQRSSDPALNYTAVVPFYGHLENRFFRDEISFVMFPLYVRSRKSDVVTDNYLFPFFHLRHGRWPDRLASSGR